MRSSEAVLRTVHPVVRSWTQALSPDLGTLGLTCVAQVE
jgi:hypothetical protein